jgi:hypothetical protein
MFLALICLWIGFAAGLVCAAILRESSPDTAQRDHFRVPPDYVI